MKRYVSLLIETGINNSYTTKHYLKNESDHDLSPLPQPDGTNHQSTVKMLEENFFIPIVEPLSAEEIVIGNVVVWNIFIFKKGGNYDRHFLYQRLG